MIRVDNNWFKDEHGRFLFLRGVNLGGSSKVPVNPNGATHLQDGFFDHRDVSFVGRPFPPPHPPTSPALPHPATHKQPTEKQQTTPPSYATVSSYSALNATNVPNKMT
ncbi:MAG: hypothetical protein GY943_02365 [Chloroflexi bacterium]|nr:hypothetical protein [Chloroflexota bacterium]